MGQDLAKKRPGGYGQSWTTEFSLERARDMDTGQLWARVRPGMPRHGQDTAWIYCIAWTWMWPGYGQAMDWIWTGYGPDMARIWLGYGLDMAWIKPRYGEDMAWI